MYFFSNAKEKYNFSLESIDEIFQLKKGYILNFLLVSHSPSFSLTLIPKILLVRSWTRYFWDICVILFFPNSSSTSSNSLYNCMTCHCIFHFIIRSSEMALVETEITWGGEIYGAFLNLLHPKVKRLVQRFEWIRLNSQPRNVLVN